MECSERPVFCRPHLTKISGLMRYILFVSLTVGRASFVAFAFSTLGGTLRNARLWATLARLEGLSPRQVANRENPSPVATVKNIERVRRRYRFPRRLADEILTDMPCGLATSAASCNRQNRLHRRTHGYCSVAPAKIAIANSAASRVGVKGSSTTMPLA